jgi:hypothetical protein
MTCLIFSKQLMADDFQLCDWRQRSGGLSAFERRHVSAKFSNKSQGTFPLYTCGERKTSWSRARRLLQVECSLSLSALARANLFVFRGQLAVPCHAGIARAKASERASVPFFMRRQAHCYSAHVISRLAGMGRLVRCFQVCGAQRGELQFLMATRAHRTNQQGVMHSMPFSVHVSHLSLCYFQNSKPSKF